MATWGMAKAKAQLSELVHEAEKCGPQIISRSGREVAVVLSLEEWKKEKVPAAGTIEPGVGSLARILLNSPLRGSGFTIPGLRERKRKTFF